MTRVQKGLALAVVHVALIGSLAVKVSMDRARYPREWVKTATTAPNPPARGRYLQLRLEVPPEVQSSERWRHIDLRQPVAFFVGEYAGDPLGRAPGEELWVEVTLPQQGPPRPIQLGVKKEGVITPTHR